MRSNVDTKFWDVLLLLNNSFSISLRYANSLTKFTQHVCYGNNNLGCNTSFYNVTVLGDFFSKRLFDCQIL